MPAPPALGTGFIFMLACVLFAGVGGYLILQVIGDNLDSQSAALIFAPLGLCWLGIFLTLNTVVFLPRLFFVLAVLWCVMIPLRIRAVGQQVSTKLLDERIVMARDLAQAHPDNPNHRFRLGELYEDRGYKREAYAEYAATLMLDRHNTRARSRSRHLYKEITGKELPEEPPDLPGGLPSNSAKAAPASPVLLSGSAMVSGATVTPASTPAPVTAPQLDYRQVELPAFSPTGPAFSASLLEFTPTIVPGGPGVPRLGGSGGVGGAPSNVPTESARIQGLRESIARGPATDRLYASLAEELMQAGRTTEASDAYRQALRLNPSNDRYRFNLQALEAAGSAPSTGTSDSRSASVDFSASSGDDSSA